MRALLCEDPVCPDAMLEYISGCYGEGFPSPERAGGNTAVVLESQLGEKLPVGFWSITDLFCIPSFDGPLRDCMADSRWSVGDVAGVQVEDAGDYV